jgi:hypothetical protein
MRPSRSSPGATPGARATWSSVGDANCKLRRSSEQCSSRSPAGEHADEIRDLGTDLQLRVFIFVDNLHTRNRPIHFAGELFNGTLVKRFVILVFVQRLHCLSHLVQCRKPPPTTQTRRLKNYGRVRLGHLCAGAHCPGPIPGPATFHEFVTMAPDASAPVTSHGCWRPRARSVPSAEGPTFNLEQSRQLSVLQATRAGDRPVPEQCPARRERGPTPARRE